jgi:hypothetical protein
LIFVCRWYAVSIGYEDCCVLAFDQGFSLMRRRPAREHREYCPTG